MVPADHELRRRELERTGDANVNAAEEADTTEADEMQRRRKTFEAEQEAARQAFERETVAATNKMQRDQDLAKVKAERDAKIAARQQELLDMALAHGLITHDDLMSRRDLLAPHAQNGAVLPSELFVDDEPTVLMGFPRTVTLTLSASDVKRWAGQDEVATDKAIAAPTIHAGTQVVFHQGYNDVPVDLADHNYLYDAGAYRASDDGTPESVETRNARIREAKAAAPARDTRGDAAPGQLPPAVG